MERKKKSHNFPENDNCIHRLEAEEATEEEGRSREKNFTLFIEKWQSRTGELYSKNENCYVAAVSD